MCHMCDHQWQLCELVHSAFAWVLGIKLCSSDLLGKCLYLVSHLTRLGGLIVHFSFLLNVCLLENFFLVKYCSHEYGIGLIPSIVPLSFPSFFPIFFYETWSPYVDQAGLSLSEIHLPLHPECWDKRFASSPAVPSCFYSIHFLNKNSANFLGSVL